MKGCSISTLSKVYLSLSFGLFFFSLNLIEKGRNMSARGQGQRYFSSCMLSCD